MAPKAVLPSNPTTSDAAKAWTKGFAKAVRDAAGPGGRLTSAKAEQMKGPYADNAKNFFERTGKASASANVVIDSGARYVRTAATRAAGADGKLSLADMAKLPADLSDDMLFLRGKGTVTEQPVGGSLKSALDAIGVPEVTDYGKEFSLSSYPSRMSRADVLRTITGQDLTDADVKTMFDSTKGAAAVSGFADEMKSIGKDERENADDATTGNTLEGLFKGVASAVPGEFTPVSRFKSVELATHDISEDGDTTWRIVLARSKDDSWKALTYSDFPF